MVVFARSVFIISMGHHHDISALAELPITARIGPPVSSFTEVDAKVTALLASPRGVALSTIHKLSAICLQGYGYVSSCSTSNGMLLRLDPYAHVLIGLHGQIPTRKKPAALLSRRPPTIGLLLTRKTSVFSTSPESHPTVSGNNVLQSATSSAAPPSCQDETASIQSFARKRFQTKACVESASTTSDHPPALDSGHFGKNDTASKQPPPRKRLRLKTSAVSALTISDHSAPPDSGQGRVPCCATDLPLATARRKAGCSLIYGTLNVTSLTSVQLFIPQRRYVLRVMSVRIFKCVHL